MRGIQENQLLSTFIVFFKCILSYFSYNLTSHESNQIVYVVLGHTHQHSRRSNQMKNWVQKQNLTFQSMCKCDCTFSLPLRSVTEFHKFVDVSGVETEQNCWKGKISSASVNNWIQTICLRYLQTARNDTCSTDHVGSRTTCMYSYAMNVQNIVQMNIFQQAK